jgi:hypothetical protein
MKINPSNKNAQELKSKISWSSLFNRKAQEEMIGFALIIVIVSVILLIFLSFSLNKPGKENVESFEVESYIQSFLQYTTSCNDGSSYLDVRELIFECMGKESCQNGELSCSVLESTLKDISKESWKIGEEYPVKGYELKIETSEEEILFIEEGNKTNNYKSALQDFSKRGESVDILIFRWNIIVSTAIIGLCLILFFVFS